MECEWSCGAFIGNDGNKPLQMLIFAAVSAHIEISPHSQVLCSWHDTVVELCANIMILLIFCVQALSPSTSLLSDRLSRPRPSPRHWKRLKATQSHTPPSHTENAKTAPLGATMFLDCARWPLKGPLSRAQYEKVGGRDWVAPEVFPIPTTGQTDGFRGTSWHNY